MAFYMNSRRRLFHEIVGYHKFRSGQSLVYDLLCTFTSKFDWEMNPVGIDMPVWWVVNARCCWNNKWNTNLRREQYNIYFSRNIFPCSRILLAIHYILFCFSFLYLFNVSSLRIFHILPVFFFFLSQVVLIFSFFLCQVFFYIILFMENWLCRELNLNLTQDVSKTYHWIILCVIYFISHCQLHVTVLFSRIFDICYKHISLLCRVVGSKFISQQKLDSAILCHAI